MDNEILEASINAMINAFSKVIMRADALRHCVTPSVTRMTANGFKREAAEAIALCKGVLEMLQECGVKNENQQRANR